MNKNLVLSFAFICFVLAGICHMTVKVDVFDHVKADGTVDHDPRNRDIVWYNSKSGETIGVWSAR